ncbi:uncharacterized protein SPPG_06066 [Spizellomyces punctatus DAOM BR117]|uniref:Uncharacterized protein n=1 Tax=Spizellomyces punctatus (strain DAOM BR117) TaxID=645134 RepID=A0A0L0HC54_SPIPD|nr:uncharacterized protein SPPG_06066 [Spizellomyces punctatus DAOM BR117]KNC98358.1 hypothetical protein SPPG_06066 [Spizellomyces punctatus DAOM BR117]|eukprot:XP_016606398.1 hypothetical protein SPPG_06066 [Spizellomyces punctatus DAOM BR117]
MATEFEKSQASGKVFKKDQKRTNCFLEQYLIPIAQAAEGDTFWEEKLIAGIDTERCRKLPNVYVNVLVQ